jgi:RimJ/RimL family protein N-acetyltransferase
MGPEINTQRLVLTKLLDSDAPALFAFRSDPEVCRYQSFSPGTLSDAEDFIAGMANVVFDTPGTWFQFGIRRLDTGEMIGDIGAHFTADDPRQVEIGFTVAPAHQGCGFGTETVTGLLDHLFGSMKKHRVFGSVDPRNAASIALLKRVGMRQEAHFRESIWFKGGWADDMIFGLLQSEWTGRSGV